MRKVVLAISITVVLVLSIFYTDVFAESDGVGISFTNIKAPLSTTSKWEWKSDITATKHIGESITAQYKVYWCSESLGISGEGQGRVCTPDLTPEDFKDTLLFENKELLVQNTSFILTHPGVECGRIQIDVGGLNGVLGGDIYDTGISCDQSPDKSEIPKSPQESTRIDAFSNLINCILVGQCEDTSETKSEEPSQKKNKIPNENKTFTSMRAIFEEVGRNVKIPPKILESIMMLENRAIFNLPPEQIKAFSKPGGQMIPCITNICSEKGALQMTTGYDSNNSPYCPNCPAVKSGIIDRCPNAWSRYGTAVLKYGNATHIPNPCNIRDNIYAAAEKLKNDAGKTLSDTIWTKEEVYRAARGFHGNCTKKYLRDGIEDTYCGHVWRYYKIWESYDGYFKK